MINYADKMEQEARLKGNLAEWMEKHGNVLSDAEVEKICDAAGYQALPRKTPFNAAEYGLKL